MGVSGIPPTSVHYVCPQYSVIGDGFSPKPDDLRCRNPMVVEEIASPRAMDAAARTHAARRYVAEERHHTYRKMLNLRPMRDGGIMSASKFTSRIHD